MNKSFTPALIEIKRASLTEDGKFSGYASTWDGEPDALGDIIKKGAFIDALAFHDRNGTTPAMLWNHDLGEPVGKWLSFSEDNHGLLAIGKLTLGTTRGREAHALLKDNAVALSIGYSVTKGGTENRGRIRHIKKIERLHEVSLVSVPANHNAKITEVKESPRCFEKALRERLGLSAREAKRVTANGWRGLVRDEQNGELQLVLDKIESLQEQISRMR